jgi:hypothetical protein
VAESSNKGFVYETKINNLLKRNGLQRKNFSPAGSDSNAPDAELRIRETDYKVEVKLDTKVDFGQGSLDYNVQTGRWSVGGAATASAEQMREFMRMIGVEKEINKRWGKLGAPRKYTVETKKFTKKDVDHDYKTFKDFFVDIPGDAVSNYYASKSTYYIQIGGGFGLYYMSANPAGIQNIKQFNLKLRLRVRLKRGGSFPINNYRFTTAIQAVNGTLHHSDGDLEDKKFLNTLKEMK